MNPIEERLKDAYAGATQTVRPEAIRDLDEQVATITWWPQRAIRTRVYWLAPLAAAAAVAVIGIVLGIGTGTPAVRPPYHRQVTQPTVVPAGSPAERFFGALSLNGGKLYIINATSGATVATIARSDPSVTFGTPATGDGVRYVLATWRPGHCGSTVLEQFTVNSSGQPGKLTPLAGLRGQVSHLWIFYLAVSGDGKTIAFAATTCQSRFVANDPHIGVIRLATGRITNWTLADKSVEYPMSLTRNGRLLEYDVGQFGPSASAVYLLPTDSPPGPAADVSRTLVTPAGIGSDVAIAGAMITPDGAHVYLYTRSAAAGPNATSFALRKVTVATGRISLIGSYQGQPVEPFAVDPAARRAIAPVSGLQAVMIDLRTGHLEQLAPPRWQTDNGGYFW